MRLIPSVSPIAAGGACFLNKAQARGEFVDTMIDNGPEMPYGRICLSVTTVEHMARLIGWAPPAEVEAMRSERDSALLELSIADEKAKRYGDALEFLGEVSAELAAAGEA